VTYAFNQIIHDRNAVIRNGDWKAPDARILCAGGEHVATDGHGHLRWFSLEEMTGEELAYLGVYEGQTYLAALVDRVPAEYEPESVRVIGIGLDDLEGSLLVHAIGLSQWHRRHGRCAQCGDETGIDQGGHIRTCGSCGAQHFPRTDPAVIMLITDHEDRALLGRQPSWPEKRFSTLAGFVEPGESLEDAVRREVLEEVGVQVGEVRYGASQPWPFPSSLMLGFFGTAATETIHIDQDEISDARWFTREEVSALTESETLYLPSHLSISRWLIDEWHGGRLNTRW